VGRSRESVRYLAAALECVHTYSLIHDDLPAMDNDDMRRGKPTAHKAFGEAVAILAGDALLTFAFEIMTSPASVRIVRPDALLSALSDLSEAAGSEKLVAGQVLDIISEGQDVPISIVESIIKRKTGALIKSALTCGARLAGGSRTQIESLGRYGDYVGAVFQIRDDMLDLEGDAAALGKAVMKDSDRGKATLPKLLGKQKTIETMMSMLDSALEEIKPFGKNAEPLALIAKYIGERLS
jgi:geranylgeranyl pyrophosphate synthase